MGSLGAAWRQATFSEFERPKLVASTPNARLFKANMSDGCSGEVEVAVRKPKISSEEALQRFFDEVQLRASLHHPNICPLLAASVSAPDYLTASPWFGGGCLFDIIHGQSVRFGFERILQLSYQFAQGLKYLHAKNIVHRDLKTANLLADENLQTVVIADMDLAIDVDKLKRNATENNGRALGRGPSNGRLKHMVGTLVYMAPEVLSGAPQTFAADVYAFAITVNEIAAACVPYVDRQLPVPELHTVLETRFNEVTLRRAIVKDHLRPISAKSCPQEFTELITQCWHPDPAQRPTMNVIVDVLQSLLRKSSEYLSQFEGAAAAETDEASDSADTTLLQALREATLQNRQPPAWNNLVNRSDSPQSVIPGVSSTPGNRGADRMEDREIVEMNIAGMQDVHIVGVYDGHGGDGCVQYVKDCLVPALVRRWNAVESTQESCLVHAYEDLDAAFLRGYPESEQSGCTALTLLFAGKEVFVANAGDCRAVLCRNGRAVVMSNDQTAQVPAERVRVEARGGRAEFVENVGQWRVNGEIAVTRSIGDRRLKPALSPTPEVTKFTITDADDFIIMATDGLWDVITPEEAVQMVQTTVRVPEMAAKRLAMKALIERQSQDNISVVVVNLKKSNGFVELVR
mmetsp:Transcript_5692/g.16934  ORF Transcript_5692/g.16934 Transcript_5692/m.16934 type:complete len:631 (+) Transcript_5692:93-1985(+)